MAVKQQPHYAHHVREMHRTRRRFWSALVAFALVFTATSYYQVGQSSAATYYFAGTVTWGTAGGQVPKPGVTIKLTNNSTGAVTSTTSGPTGVWQIAVPQNAEVSIAISSSTPAGFANPVATLFKRLNMTATPSYATRADYPYQAQGWSCYQNSACSNANYRAYDVNASYEHSMDFSYVAAAPVISSFAASPPSIAYNGKTTLSWATANVANCTITPSGPVSTTVKSWTTGALSASTTYTATCKNLAGNAVAKSVVVTVAKPPTPAPATPTPAPGKTPTPAPGKTPTPVPGGGTTGGGTTGGGTTGGGSTSGGTAGGSGSQPATPDTTPPSAPSNFQALVSGTNAVMNLSWTAATDDVGVANYVLERSLDQQQWTVITNQITGTTYTDDSLSYDVTYYYRLKAVDAAGNMSGYATADGHTPVFTATNSGDSPVTYTSDDKVASATVPTNAIDGQADCSIEAQTQSLDTGKLVLVAGPFALVCKNSSGDAVTDLAAPVAWSFKIKDKLKGLQKPQVDQLDNSGNSSAVKDYKYSAKTGEMTFSLASFNAVYVLGAKGAPFPWNFIAILFVILAIIGGVLFVVVRQTQKRSYDDYLTKKYYNL